MRVTGWWTPGYQGQVLAYTLPAVGVKFRYDNLYKNLTDPA